MNNIAALIQLTLASSHALSEGTLRLEQRPGIASRRFFRDQMGNTAASVLTQVAAAQELSRSGYFSRLEALALLQGARKSAGELKMLLKTASGRRYADERELGTVCEKCDETMAMLMASTVTLRGETMAGTAA